jgi:glycosyltransferase involved in cell wall biosynthesis
VRVVPSAGRAEVHDALRIADLFVFPTLSEGFSKALLEAMAAGLPIVTTPVGAAPDLLRHGENALLVPPADAQAISAAVTTYLRDPALASRHGGAARAAAGAYTLDTVCRQWADVLYEAVDRHVRAPHRVEGRRDVAL